MQRKQLSLETRFLITISGASFIKFRIPKEQATPFLPILRRHDEGGSIPLIDNIQETITSADQNFGDFVSPVGHSFDESVFSMTTLKVDIDVCSLQEQMHSFFVTRPEFKTFFNPLNLVRLFPIILMELFHKNLSILIPRMVLASKYFPFYWKLRSLIGAV